jgi:hypothetical protein
MVIVFFKKKYFWQTDLVLLMTLGIFFPLQKWHNFPKTYLQASWTTMGDFFSFFFEGATTFIKSN